MPDDLIADLEWRGLIAQSTDRDALAAELTAGPVSAYFGCDPTAPSLHAGNLVGLLLLRRLQLAGHRVMPLAGGATGLIGDPSGRDTERQLLDVDTIRERVGKIRTQMERFLDLGEGKGLLVDNLDWTAPMSAIDFLRDVGKHFPVNVLLQKESVSARLAGGGLSYTEFSYSLLQANDYLELFRRHGCRLQIGGSDQWGNIVAGVDLIRRVEGASVHALTFPLITDASGAKFGKSTGGGSVWLDPEMTSPYAFFQFWVNADDRDVVGYLKVFSFRTRLEIEALAAAAAERPHAREAQRALAEELTELVHGPEALAGVLAATEALFGAGDVRTLSPTALADALAGAPSLSVAPGAVPPVPALLVELGLCKSTSDARSRMSQGGVYLNGERVEDPSYVPTQADLLHGRYVVLRVGKRSYGLVTAAGVRRAAASI
ncbi:MAG TPA: tyrosine--tRNA ligase [Mycobacteriales bacterium]|nr:tyrosine--tRNA ligase [Mycobacteriales bacterium]